MFGIETGALVVLFLIFIFLVYKGIKILFRYLLIAGISALFPIIAINYFGFNWPLTLGTILTFVYLGILGYTIYLGLSVLEGIGKPVIRLFGGGNKDKKMEKRLEKLEKEKEDKE